MKIPDSFNQPIRDRFPRLHQMGNWIARILAVVVALFSFRILFRTFLSPDNPKFWTSAQQHVSFLGPKVALLVLLMAIGIVIIVRESRYHGFFALHGVLIVLVVTLSLASLDPQHKDLSRLSDQFHMQMFRAALALAVYVLLKSGQRLESRKAT